MQIAAALSAFASLSPLQRQIIKNFKIESPLSWSPLFQTSDLIVAGHQIGEAGAFAKIEEKKSETNRQTGLQKRQ
jgi:methionyl-tRNA synthetase